MHSLPALQHSIHSTVCSLVNVSMSQRWAFWFGLCLNLLLSTWGCWRSALSWKSWKANEPHIILKALFSRLGGIFTCRQVRFKWEFSVFFLGPGDRLLLPPWHGGLVQPAGASTQVGTAFYLIQSQHRF